MSNGNGSTKILYWLLGLLAAALIGITGAWGKTVTEKADKVPAIEERQVSQQRQLDRIEGMLEELLKRGR